MHSKVSRPVPGSKQLCAPHHPHRVYWVDVQSVFHGTLWHFLPSPYSPSFFSSFILFFERKREGSSTSRSILHLLRAFSCRFFFHAPVSISISCPRRLFFQIVVREGNVKKKVKLPCSRFSFPILRIYKNLKLYLKKKER